MSSRPGHSAAAARQHNVELAERRAAIRQQHREARADLIGMFISCGYAGILDDGNFTAVYLYT